MDPVMNTILEPEVKLTIGGKERTFRIDFNTLALIEERTGKSFMDMANWSALKTKDLRSMVWAALVHEDPALIEAHVGKWLTVGNMTEVMNQFGKAMYISMKGELPPEAVAVPGEGSPLAPTEISLVPNPIQVIESIGQ